MRDCFRKMQEPQIPACLAGEQVLVVSNWRRGHDIFRFMLPGRSANAEEHHDRRQGKSGPAAQTHSTLDRETEACPAADPPRRLAGYTQSWVGPRSRPPESTVYRVAPCRNH